MNIETQEEQNKPENFKVAKKKKKRVYFLFLGWVFIIHDRSFPNFLYTSLLHNRFLR